MCLSYRFLVLLPLIFVFRCLRNNMMNVALVGWGRIRPFFLIFIHICEDTGPQMICWGILSGKGHLLSDGVLLALGQG